MSSSLINQVTGFIGHEDNQLFSDEAINVAVQGFFQQLSSEDDREHRTSVFQSILKNNKPLRVLSGPPGSAKTYLAAQAFKFFQTINNGNVWAMSKSQIAVDRLLEKADGTLGVTFENFWKNPNVIPNNAIVIIDEAGLIGTQEMVDLFAAAAEKSWSKLLLLGDYRQDIPDNPGQPLRVLEENFPTLCFSLKTGFRQKTPEQRAIVSSVYRGDAYTALKTLSDNGCLHFCDNTYGVEDEALMSYLRWRSEGDNFEKTALILTQSDAVADEINALVTAKIRSYSDRCIWPLIKNCHALSIKQAQGLAVDQSFLVITDKVIGQTMVSACSRHRYDLKIYVDQAVYADIESLGADASNFNLDKVGEAKLANRGGNAVRGLKL